MFGKKLSEYVRFQGWVLALIVIAFALRFALSASWASMNTIGLIGLLYYAVGVPLARFGSYKELLALLIIQTAVTHGLIALAITLGIATGTDNMFTRPEYFGGNDGKTWIHVGLHVIAIAILPFISWVFGAPILFITKKLRPA